MEGSMSLPSPQPGVLSRDYSSRGYSWTARALNGVSWSKHRPIGAYQQRSQVPGTREGQGAPGTMWAHHAELDCGLFDFSFKWGVN